MEEEMAVQKVQGIVITPALEVVLAAVLLHVVLTVLGLVLHVLVAVWKIVQEVAI
jgi:hypothetical protein